MIGDDGKLAIEWTTGDVLPQQLVDILATNETDQSGGDVNQNDDYVLYEPYQEEIEEDDQIENIIDMTFDEESVQDD